MASGSSSALRAEGAVSRFSSPAKAPRPPPAGPPMAPMAAGAAMMPVELRGHSPVDTGGTGKGRYNHRGRLMGAESMLAAWLGASLAYAALEIALGVSSSWSATVSEGFRSLGGVIAGGGCLWAARAARGTGGGGGDGDGGRFSYGPRRAEPVAALLAGCHVLFCAFTLAMIAVQEAVEAAEEEGDVGVGLALGKALIDLVGLGLLRRHVRMGPGPGGGPGSSLGGAALVVAADCLRRGGEAAAAAAVGGGGGPLGAAIARGFVAAGLVTMAVPVLKASALPLMQATPEGVDDAALRKCLRQAAAAEGVVACHSARLWDMGPGGAVGTVEVSVRPGTDEQLVLQHVVSTFESCLGPVDLTVQVEVDEGVGMR